MTLEEIQAYFDRIETENLWQALLFDAKLERPLLDERYIYYSSLRPFAALPALRKAMKLTEADVLANVVTRKGQEFGVVLTMEPLPYETVEAFDLLLDRYHTYAPLLQQYVGNKPAVAFREPPGAHTDWGYLLFRNPRGNWQLSTFQPELGPVGHTESKDKYELLREALRYRPDSGAYVEAIMSTATGSVPLDGLDGLDGLDEISTDPTPTFMVTRPDAHATVVGYNADDNEPYSYEPMLQWFKLVCADGRFMAFADSVEEPAEKTLEDLRSDFADNQFSFHMGDTSMFVVLSDTALAALQVWLDGLIERGLLE